MLVTALLWPPINTAQLEFHLYPENTLDLVCFAVELTGCLFSNGKCIATHMHAYIYVHIHVCIYVYNII